MDQLKAEAALHESQQTLAILMNNLPGMVYRRHHDQRWTIEFVSTGCTKLTGFSPSELIHNRKVSFAELIHPEHRDTAWETIQEAINEQHSYRVSYPIRTATGEEKWVWEQGSGIYSGQGDLQILEGLVIDITERKRTEEEMTRLRLYLKNIIDSMPSILVGVDSEGRILEWNRPAEQASGVSLKEAHGRFLGEIFPRLEIQLQHVKRAIQQRQPIKTPRIATEVDGETHYADVMVYPLVANGAIGAVIRVDDVTARVRIEDMMVQTEKMLSVGGLAAGMAHEINNPLGAILQACQNILRRLSPDLSKNREVAQALGLDLDLVSRYLQERGILHFLKGIQEAGARSVKIVSDMLAFSRRSESHFTHVDLGETLDTALRLAASDYDLKKKYDFKHIHIVRDYDPDLRLIYCDKTQIEQVILNLVKNAAQAMANAAIPSPTITLRTRQEPGYARIEVADNGPGMDENIRRRVFEPFFTTKEAGVGTGLGLSVSYFIVTEQHKGTLSVTSTPAQGTHFIIRLPLTAEE